MTRKTSTFLGFIAILLWSLLAFLTAKSGSIPPFQLVAMSFAVGSMIGVISWIFRPHAVRALKQPISLWIISVGAFFGYHFTYFTALKNAPPVEAGLVAYLWPLLIILFSALLPNEKLKWNHIAGGVLGFLGVVLIVTGGSGIHFNSDYFFGYTMALLCAFIWSAYSVFLKRLSNISTDVVTGFCLATAVCAFVAHSIMEETVWPSNNIEWFAVLGLGLGPIGLAFYLWDFGMKHGDIQLLGASSYLAPLFSTLLLISAGYAEFTQTIVFACILITVGALIAAKGTLLASK